MNLGTTLLDKIWAAHEIERGADGQSLLFVDRHLVHDGSRQAFEQLEEEGRSVRRPDCTFATADHYVPTRGGDEGFPDSRIREMVTSLSESARRWGIRHYGLGNPRQGIVHVIGPELGLTQPGLVLVCGDSHTSTHGALGAYAFGIGSSEVAHVLATQTLWQTKPLNMRVWVDGELAPGATAKDLVLALIARIGAAGATGHVVEYAGSAIEALSIEARMTLCNMSIEAGARAGLIAPDTKTVEYLYARSFAPQDELWTHAVAEWQRLRSDPDARFESEIAFSGAEVEPTVTWGTSPEDAVPVGGRVPDPDDELDTTRRARMRQALDYMQLAPGTAMTDIAIDRVFIGSCTNSRIEDLRAAARIVRGRHATVPAMVVPGSGAVKQAAESEGLDRVFREAGFDWREPGCSMCVAMNGVDIVAPGERCASTSNRNFPGRQGRGACTHLMSPASAAATAIRGRIADARAFVE